ncbi:hypothetical protein HPB49_008310 [Dermacentor silvarum]|uniref:Uncharacterized protein n=1 Tax=Dermacentor silvarum TaxID=543639 RepID=A0ACB8D414_DERSI|nr:hypothetical protein HPB49_008310 [Dermacentor silvarum]
MDAAQQEVLAADAHQLSSGSSQEDTMDLHESPWIEVTRRANRRSPPPPRHSTLALDQTLPKPALRRGPGPRQPRQPPLPMEDYKVGIRPRNGLPLTKINPMHLTTAIAREAGIPNSPSPFQLRIDEEQNVIVVSTPSPAMEKALETLQKITVGGNTYEVAVYPIAPDNSCKGVIYNIGMDCSVEEVRAVVEAPGYEVLTIRRLGSSSALAITFKGKKVPFYIYVHRVLTRCYLYKRTVAYCTTCHQTGHRADVCPNHPTTPRCKDCGVTLSGKLHECHPQCGLCGGAHATAIKPCLKRFLPPVYQAKPAAQMSPPPPRRSRTPSPGLRGPPALRHHPALDWLTTSGQTPDDKALPPDGVTPFLPEGNMEHHPHLPSGSSHHTSNVHQKRKANVVVQRGLDMFGIQSHNNDMAYSQTGACIICF